MKIPDAFPLPPGSWRLSDDVRFRRVGPVALKDVSRDVVTHQAERA